MNMPKYTLDQRAAAFDLLWKNCGHAPAELHNYKAFTPRPVTFGLEKEQFITRIPVYQFRLLFDGECSNFKDVLHHLATKEKAPDL